jgi:diguanylate cyclase
VAALGPFAGLMGNTLGSVAQDSVRQSVLDCLTRGVDISERAVNLHIGLANDRMLLLHAQLESTPTAEMKLLLETLRSALAVGFDNVALYGQLLDHAYNDQLLQLPNRNRFIELLEAHLRNPEGLTLALIDIDDFSDINDALSQRLGQRGEMARISADTFGLMGPENQISAESVAAAFVEPFLVAGERLQLSATTGLVRLIDSSSLGSELLLDAHIALKRAKVMQRGSAQYFSAEMGVDARERFKLLKGLRASFEARRLFVVYQPQVDLATRQPIAVEALLRWRTEDGQFVPPDQFIPLAEQSGLIIAIGEFVLRTACHQILRLREVGPPGLRMAVNISMAQFRHPLFVTILQAALRDTELPGDALELEITESMAMEDLDMVLAVLASIRATGATVAIDDFGTGFSSLSQLRQLQVERLKIDRAFVNETSTAAGASIASMVVNLGCTLGMRVLAEGIETEEQAQHLHSMGCHEGQGYHFARPMPAELLEGWLAPYRQD